VLTGMEYSAGYLDLYFGLFLLIGITNALSWRYVAFLTDILRPPPGVASAPSWLSP
jgi:hypothetical protein